MPLFEWTPSYSVSVPQFDKEHQHLIGLINTLNDAMRAGQGRLAIRGILDSLVSYTHYHFKGEEEAMKKALYPELASHIEEHRALTAQVEAFVEQYERGETAITIDVLYFLRDWLLNHIVSTDQKYGEYLNRP